MDDSLSFPRKLKLNTDRELVIDQVRLEDLDEITDFIQQHFQAEIPNSYLIPYDEKRAESFRPFLSTYIRLIISQSVSLCVRDPRAGGRLAAVRLNKMEYRNDPKEKPWSAEKEEQSPQDKLLIFALLESLNEGINLFDLYNTDTILHLERVAVSRDYTRMGLAGELYRLSIEIAKNVGAGAIVTEAVSEYAQAAAQKFGLQTLKEIVYEEYELEDGSRPYAPCTEGLGVHRTAKLMARSLKLQ
jgi:GNAT superfamily N-acetyltransferase